MKEWKDSPVIKNALSIIFAGLVLISFYFALTNFEGIKSIVNGFVTIVSPFLYASFIAFLISPLVRWFEYRALSVLKIKQTTKHVLSVIMTVIVVVEIITLFFAVLIPQFITSVSTISESFPDYIDSFNIYIAPLIENYVQDQQWILDILNSSSDIIQQLLNLIQTYVPNIVDFSVKLSQTIVNIILTIVITLYILLDEDGFTLQIKRFIQAYFGQKIGETINSVLNLTSYMLHRFILGKAFNSLIMGVLLYITMLIMQVPYPVFLSSIFGVTNMIPFFGPFIGGLIGVIILFLEDPVHSLYFLVAILVLQQIEGTILSPIVIGDSMGLPSIWVFFAIIVGGGYFGVAGMFLGIPIFAVIYLLIQRSMDIRLAQQEEIKKEP